MTYTPNEAVSTAQQQAEYELTAAEEKGARDITVSVDLLRTLLWSSQEAGAAAAAATPHLSDFKNYMTAGELMSAGKHVTTLNTAGVVPLSVGSHSLFDENGEAIGEVTYDGDAGAYVFSFDYIPQNHTGASA